MAVGFVLTTIVFILFMTINGASGVSAIVSILILILAALGLFGSATGLFLLRSRDLLTSQARNGFVLQGIGLAGLFFAVILAASSSSFTAFLVSAVVLAASAAFTFAGAILTKGGFAKTHSPRTSNVNLLLFGMILLFFGAALIIGFNILAVTYYLSNVDAIIFEDIGATASAYGCVLGSYSILRLFR